jgi:hypothetical protein
MRRLDIIIDENSILLGSTPGISCQQKTPQGKSNKAVRRNPFALPVTLFRLQRLKKTLIFFLTAWKSDS